jgi:hypothetical protein
MVAMAGSGGGRDRINPHLSTNNGDSSRPKKQRARQSCGRGESKGEGVVRVQQYHSRLWYRCAFLEKSKCDYLTNNVSESFNAQIKKSKGLLLHELLDSIRELIMEKRYIRKKIGRQMQDDILPGVIKELNTISKNLKVVRVIRSDEHIAEVTLFDNYNNQKRHSVDLQNYSCSCREWQLTGKPCKHALAWILSNRGIKIADFVHEYYSVARFRATYAARVEPIPDRT